MGTPRIHHSRRHAAPRQSPAAAPRRQQRCQSPPRSSPAAPSAAIRPAQLPQSSVARPYAQGTKPVLLWPDTWNNYYHPQTLAAAQHVLESAGFEVRLPGKHLCCGRPLYDFGFLAAARRYLVDILETLAPEIDAGLPIVFLEPSCASVFLDELRNFFPPDNSAHGTRAAKLRNQSFLLSDFLARYAPQYQPPSLAGQKLIVHAHCHHKSIMKMDSELDLLHRTGADVTHLDSGCCGMAGPFGFEREKFEVSQILANRVLLPAVRQAAPQTILVTDGFSCREQISQNSPRRALHLAEVLAGPKT